MRIQKILLALTPLIFLGCIAYDPQRSKVNSYFHEEIHKQNTVYSDKKMQNPKNAIVLEANSSGINTTALEALTYEVSLLAFGALQTMDPNFSLESLPVQYIKLSVDGNTTEILYIVYAEHPYTFRKNDNVVVDVNKTSIVSIRPSNINPENIDNNESNKTN